MEVKGGAFVRPPKFSKLIKYFEKSSLFIVVVLEELMCISILLHIAWRAPQPVHKLTFFKIIIRAEPALFKS